MKGGIDWRALLAGTGIASVSFVLYLLFVVAIMEPNFGGVLSKSNTPWYALMIVFTLPGALTAGHLQGSKPSRGAIYGIAAVMLGVVFPVMIIVVGVQLIIGIPLFLFGVVTAFLGGIWVMIGTFSGAVGGAFGAMTSAKRVD